MKKFDFNKIDDFDKHISLSIPNYEFLKEHIVYLIEALTEENTNILDLGCSTGSLLKSIDKRESCQYFGYDTSNLLPSANQPNIHFQNKDIVKDSLVDNCSIISSIFTLQFLPSHERKNVIQKIHHSLNEGGYFILCEKTHSVNPLLENITNSIYYRFKKNSFSAEEILEKQQQLASSMKLKTMDEIEKELSIFSHFEVFWKSYGFVGYIIKK